jgi:hypothetical protein
MARQPETKPAVRPGPLRWLRYTYGGTLPDRYRDWVRYDNTSRTWMPRHILRILVQALPVMVIAFVVLFVWTPVPAWAIVGVLLVGLLISLFLTIGTAREFSAVRLAKHGFPPEVSPPPSRLIPEDAGAEDLDR